MAVPGWGSSVATAIGVGAAVSAAQLGLGYGLNIIRFAPDAGGQLPTQVWVASLTWATWVAATSAIVGAVVAYRLGSRRHRATREPDLPEQEPGDLATTPVPDPATPGDRITTGLWRLVLAVAGALGAAVTIVLVAVPARAAELDEVASPQTVAAGYAALGVVASLLLAVGSLAARAVTANILTTAAWLWVLAAVAVTDGVLAGATPTRVPLAFWEATADGPWFRSVLLPDAGLALVAALGIGLLAALPAARRGDHPVGVVTSGAAGPLVLAIAYLLTQPNLVSADAVDLSRQVVVPYLALAGLLGSLLASALRPRWPVPLAPSAGPATAGQAVTGRATATRAPVPAARAGAASEPVPPAL